MASPALLDPIRMLPTPELPHSEANCKPNKLTRPFLLSALKQCSSLNHLQEIHAQMLKTGFFFDDFTVSKLISSSAISKFANIDYASSIFCSIDSPNLFTWNTMIRAYSSTSDLSELALSFYIKMQEQQGLKPNKHTFTFALRACAQNLALCEGEQIHGAVLKSGLVSDRYIQNSLIRCYSRCSRIELARRVFDKIPLPDLVSATVMVDGYSKAGRTGDAREVFDGVEVKDEFLWTAMISGYARSDQPMEALRLFRVMLRQYGLVASEGAIVSMLAACARLGSLETGRWLHRYLQINGLEPTIKVATALIDMHAKCGSMDVARQLFDEIPHPDVVAWNAMISGLALQGDGRAALGMLQRMEKAGVRPNESTLVAILTACAHSGMVEEGREKWNQMMRVYKILPRIDHYGCMVDMFSRAGCLKEAEEFIRAMPVRADGAIWRSLLDGCRNKNDVVRAEWAMSQLLELGFSESTDFVLLANIYASLNRYGEAGEVRKLMKERGIEKRVGRSWIEVGGVVHGFVAGDKSHPMSDEIYRKLMEVMELFGGSYEPEKGELGDC